MTDKLKITGELVGEEVRELQSDAPSHAQEHRGRAQPPTAFVRACQAACEAGGDDWFREGPEGLVEAYGPMVRAALESIREPDGEWGPVRIAGYAVLCSNEMPPNPEEHWEGWVAPRVFRAMIDALLASQEER